jgi:hypothetical protein
MVKRKNDSVVNVILNSINESVTLLFGNMTTKNEIWNVLITRYECNL